MVSVKAVLQGQLFVLLALQSTTEAVTAVVVELSTTILSVRFMLELLVMVCTLTLVVLLLTLQPLKQEHVQLQMLQTHTTAVLILAGKTRVGQMQLVRRFVLELATKVVFISTLTPALVTCAIRHL
jgi:hypothetical protein